MGMNILLYLKNKLKPIIYNIVIFIFEQVLVNLALLCDPLTKYKGF